MNDLLHETGQKTIDLLHESLAADDIARARTLLHTMHVSEIADVLEGLPVPERARLWHLIDPARRPAMCWPPSRNGAHQSA